MSWGRGKRTLEWERIRARLKLAFEAAGITRCEFCYEGCSGGLFLSFAHGRKRRNLTTEELKKLVALACANCHSLLELKPEKEMHKAVVEVIAKRICQP